MVTKHNAYDVQLASKTNPAARYVLATDYAELESENVELKKQCAAFHAEASDHYRASIAANATLDALWDLFAPDKVISNSTCMKAVDILYPTPDANPCQ